MKNLCRVLIFCCAVVATAAAHSASAENDAIAHYSNRAVELLRDAISRETAYGQGLVPAYAESLRQVFLDAGFPPEALTIVPYGCLLYTSPSPRDYAASRMPSSA